MGKMAVTRVYHLGLQVNDFERSKKFYVDLLGMKAGEHGRKRSLESTLQRHSRLLAGNVAAQVCHDDVAVVLVKRPTPINRDWKENSFNHTAISASKEDFDRLLENMKERGTAAREFMHTCRKRSDLSRQTHRLQQNPQNGSIFG